MFEMTSPDHVSLGSKVVYPRVYPVDGLSPRAQKFKKGGCMWCSGPKSKRGNAPGIKVKKVCNFVFWILGKDSVGEIV